MPTDPGDSTDRTSDASYARRKGESDAWGAFGLVVSGVLVWGGVGFLVGAWLDSTLPRLVGLLVGMAAGLYLVWFRYGRPTAAGTAGPDAAGRGRTP